MMAPNIRATESVYHTDARSATTVLAARTTWAAVRVMRYSGCRGFGQTKVHPEEDRHGERAKDVEQGAPGSHEQHELAHAGRDDRHHDEDDEGERHDACHLPP